MYNTFVLRIEESHGNPPVKEQKRDNNQSGRGPARRGSQRGTVRKYVS